LDAAGLAASAGMDLRLDHIDRAAEVLSCLHGFIDRKGCDAARNRCTEARQDGLGLVLVDIHGNPLAVGSGSAGAADLKFLHRLPQARPGTSKSKSGT